MKKRIFSMLLAIMMVLTTVDITAFAQPIEETTVEDVTEEETVSGEEESPESESSVEQTTDTVEETSSEMESAITEEMSVVETTEEMVSTEEETTEIITSEESTEAVTEVEAEMQEVVDVLATGSVTRIEWLQTLVETFEMTVESDNYPDNYFSDIDSTYEYYHDVMVATEFGLVDVEAGDPLEPDVLATREFAAHSLNVCLGYVSDSESYSFDEAETVDYPDDIQVAIDRSWFVLSNGKFLPDQAITTTEMNAMVADAQSAINATTIDPNHENTYDLKDNVIVLPEGTDAHLTDENEITIYNCTQELKEGDIFALISNGFPAVKKVKSIAAEEDALIIQTESVDTEDAFNSIDIQGNMEVDLTEIQAADSNTTLKYIVGGTKENEWEDGTKYASVEAVGNQKISAVEVIKSYDIPQSIKEEYELADGVKATVSCKVTGVNVDYDSTSSSAYFHVGATTTFSCNVSMDILQAIGQAPSITLVKIPVAYVAYMTLTLEMALEGELNIRLVEYISAGVYYDSASGFRITKHFYKESFTIQAEAKASLGLKAAISIDWCVLKGSIYAKVGVTAHIKSELYTDGNEPLNCTHLNAYLYASVGCNVSVDLLLYKDSWSKSKDIYTMYNSPIKVSHHYEDGLPVAECTRDAQLESGSKKWKYYTPADSKYSYSGASSGTGSNGETYKIFDYTLDSSNQATITGYYGNVSALSIPETLDGYTVVKIGSRAFEGNTSLQMVVIPDTVTRISENAFRECSNLSEVILSKSLTTIEYGAFYNCDALTAIEIPKSLSKGYRSNDLYGDTNNGPFAYCDNLKIVTFEKGTTQIAECLFVLCTGLEEIEIPDTVTVIEDYAFYLCTNLKKIEIPDSVTTIGTYAFSECSSLSKVSISDSVKSIKASAFRLCNALEEVTIPDSVTYIGDNAFRNCAKLSKVKLSKSLVEIEYGAFYNCDALTEIEIPKSLSAGSKMNDLYGDTNNGPFAYCDNLKIVTFEKGTTQIAECLFVLCTGLEEIEIPDTVTVIEDYAFYLCTNLKKIEIPDSVTTIGTYAFSECSSLSEVSILDGVKSIKASAFRLCNALEEVAIPDSVTYIGDNAFRNCAKLSKVKLSKSLVEIEYGAFYNCDALTEIEIPRSLSAGSKMNDLYGNDNNGPFAYCDNLKKVTFEEGATQIAEYLFVLCTGLEEIEIPDTVTVIEEYAFYLCTNLKKVTIPESVISINYKAFQDCTSLETVQIAEGLTTLNDDVFKNCSSLKEITLPNTVTSMGTYIFEGCTKLEKAVLPNKRMNVTEGTFKNCSSLKEITLPETVSAIRAFAFYGNTALAKVTGGENVTTIEKSAFYNCDALTEMMISDKCTSIATYAFAECENLSDVKLGSGLTTIPTYAFYQCPSLAKIELPYAVTTVQGYAFANCTSLTEVTIPRATTSIADTVFSYPSKMTIYGIAGTYAETFANDKGITFVNQEVNATDVQLLQTELTVNKGSSTRLVLSVTPSNFTDAVKWKSSDAAVATVDSTGTVKAVGLGTTKIVVSVNGITKNCMVTVVQPVTSISINKSSLSLDGGGTYQLKASVYPSSANNKEIAWSSSDETVATVSETGLVTALKKGSAMITVTAQDGSGVTDTCNVTVKSTVYMALTVEEMQSSHPYEDNCMDSWVYTVPDAESLEVFFSEDTEVEEEFDYIYIYTGAGKQVGKYTGTALSGKKVIVKGDTVRIQLVSDDATNAYGFRVTEIREKLPTIALKSILLNKEVTELFIGDTTQLTVNYNPANATVDSAVTWKSSNEDVATVENGLITAVGKGTATITASVSGKSAKCAVIVKQPIEDILITPADVELHVGETVCIGVSMLPAGAQPSGTIQWSGYDGSILSVKALHSEYQAEVNALQSGMTEIKVSVDGKEKTCSVTVLPNTIALDYQDGSAEGSIEATVGEPISNLPTEPVRENYIFAGWYTGTNGSGELVTTDTILKDQWKLYAYWMPVEEGMWVRPIGDQTYTGKVIKPVVEVYDGSTLLVLGQDYTVSYKNNKKVADINAVKAPTVTVKGKGQYKDSAKVYFNIVPKSIEDMDVKTESVYKKITNKVQKAVPVIKWGKVTLKKGRDFVVTYPETEAGAYKTAGQYEIVITGTGNYTGERSVWQVLSEKEKILMSKVSVKKIADEPWTGSEICPVPVVTYKKALLTEGVDYELEYENNTTLGTATIKIVGKGIYSGVKKVTFKITGLNLAKAKMSAIDAYTYSGEAYEPHPTLILGEETLTEGKDYTVSYSKNVNAGKAKILFTGIGRCKGTLKKSFTIGKYNIIGHELEEKDIVCEYSKSGSKPEITLIINGVELTAGKDYKISYSRNSAVNDGSNVNKQPMITVKGIGNYSGQIKQPFVITAKNLQDVTIGAQDVVIPVKKNKWKSTPVLTDTNGKKLKAGTDYAKNFEYVYAEDAVMQDGTTRSQGTVVDKNDIPAVGSKIQITVTGIKNYEKTTTVTYSIVPASVAKAKVTIPAQSYSGKAITLEESDITVKVGGKEIDKEDFEIVPDSHVNNIKKGTASVTIRGTRNYGGTKVVNFKIIPKSIVWRILDNLI